MPLTHKDKREKRVCLPLRQSLTLFIAPANANAEQSALLPGRLSIAPVVPAEGGTGGLCVFLL